MNEYLFSWHNHFYPLRQYQNISRHLLVLTLSLLRRQWPWLKVQRQLELLRFRNSFGAFGFDATCEVAETASDKLSITWRKDGLWARLDADLASETFEITTS